MATFNPPSIAEVPPVGAKDENPLGARLMRFYQSRQRGVAVFKMSDGTYQIARQVPGVNVKVLEPWPPVPRYPSDLTGGVGVPNDAISWSFDAFTGTSTKYGVDGSSITYDGNANIVSTTEATQPWVVVVYYGGVSYPVSTTEADALTAAGLGAYVSGVSTSYGRGPYGSGPYGG